jgi:hypothetical protein
MSHLGISSTILKTMHVHYRTTTLSFFLDGLFPKTEIPYMRDASSGDKIIRR